MSVIADKGGMLRLDVTAEVQAVDRFMRDASPERRIALVAWYLRFMDSMPAELRGGVLQGAQQINAQSKRRE